MDLQQDHNLQARLTLIPDKKNFKLLQHIQKDKGSFVKPINESQMAKVVFSYDCESKWGMLDHLEDLNSQNFSEENISSIYKLLYDIHENYNVAATFAFVGAFTLPKKEFIKYLSANLISNGHLENWISNISLDMPELEEKEFFYPQLIPELKKRSFNFEIATHGFTHAILTEVNDAELVFEADGIKLWSEFHGISVKTIIFPRNQISSNIFSLLPCLEGYRRPPRNIFNGGIPKKLYSIGKEFWPLVRSEHVVTQNNGVKSLPGDFFINWRSGPRLLVSEKLTLLRARLAIDHAIRNRGIINFWLHPHNLITGNKQIKLLAAIVEYVSKLQAQGRLCSCTQRDLI